MPDLAPEFLLRPIAHRGLHDAGRGVIENSRAAVAAAIAGGYGIEIDVQRAADGEAMVFHDDDLPRLTGAPGPLAAMGADDLGRLTLRGCDETIPTLAQVLALVAGRAPLLIEVKDQTRAMGPEVGPLEARVGALLAGYAGPVALMSFNPHSVAALAATAPGVARGLTIGGPAESAFAFPADRPSAEPAAVTEFDRVGACFVSYDRHQLESPAVAAFKRRGVPVLTWTIRSPAQEAAARKVADNITFEGYAAARPD